MRLQNLGYAVTAYRAQGMTVDTSHVVVAGSTTREHFYVAMTRGRDRNTAYVALDQPDDAHLPPEHDERNARTVLFGVLQHTGVLSSAHDTITAEQTRWGGIAQLAAEFDHLAATVQHARWQAIVRRALTEAGNLSPSEVDAALAAEGFGALAAELHGAEANGHDVATLLPRVIAGRSLLDVDDVAAVLSSRLGHVAARTTGNSEVGLIVGLIPDVRATVPADVRAALDTRRQLIERRATELAEEAVRSHAPWVQRLGDPPLGTDDRARWLRQVITVAAYRDRYAVTGPNPIGTTKTPAQQRDAKHALAATRRARTLTDASAPRPARAHAASLAR